MTKSKLESVISSTKDTSELLYDKKWKKYIFKWEQLDEEDLEYMLDAYPQNPYESTIMFKHKTDESFEWFKNNFEKISKELNDHMDKTDSLENIFYTEFTPKTKNPKGRFSFEIEFGILVLVDNGTEIIENEFSKWLEENHTTEIKTKKVGKEKEILFDGYDNKLKELLDVMFGGNVIINSTKNTFGLVSKDGKESYSKTHCSMDKDVILDLSLETYFTLLEMLQMEYNIEFINKFIKNVDKTNDSNYRLCGKLWFSRLEKKFSTNFKKMLKK